MKAFHFFKHCELLYMFTELTLDDKTETEAAKGEVGEHRLLLRLAYNVISSSVTVELESQSELSRLDAIFDLKESKVMTVCKQAAHTDRMFSVIRLCSVCYIIELGNGRAGIKMIEHQHIFGGVHVVTLLNKRVCTES